MLPESDTCLKFKDEIQYMMVIWDVDSEPDVQF